MRTKSRRTVVAPRTDSKVAAAASRSRTASCMRSTRSSMRPPLGMRRRAGTLLAQRARRQAAARLGGVLLCRLICALLLAFADNGDLGAADGTSALRGRAPVLQGHRRGVLHLALGAALQAVTFHEKLLLWDLTLSTPLSI